MDENEFIKNFELYSDPIFRFCLVKTSSREEARDITQESFMKVWQAISRGVEIENFRAFLYTTARNLIIDYYRKKKSVSLDELTEAGADFYGNDHKDIVADLEIRKAVDEINKLDETYREIVHLRLVEGVGPKEISEILDLPENTVSVRLNRGMAKIRETLGY